MSMKKVLFHERQYFRQAAVWIMLAAIDLVVVASLVYMLTMERDAGDQAALWAIYGSLLLSLLMTWMFLRTCLEVKVTTSGIHYRFTLFQREPRLLEPAMVQEWAIRDIRPVMEFGGFGIRKSKNVTAYLVSGKKAIVFDLKDGKKLVIGTQKPDSMESALRQLIH